MATRVTKLPARIVATDTAPHNLGLLDSVYKSGGTCLVVVSSGNVFFQVDNEEQLDKAYAVSGNSTLPPFTFGPSIGDVVYQATSIGDTFNVY